MRRGIVLGIGLTFAAPTAALAQFAADRTPPRPAAQPAAPAPTPVQQPAVPAAYTAPQTQAAPAVPHQWYVKPEHGGWMICVKSYMGEGSLKLAEELAAEVRQKHTAGAYLYEWGAEEKRKEYERREKLQAELREQYAPFLKTQEEIRKKAEAQGVEMDRTPFKIRVPKIEYKEQWAVLVGGFKDMDAARKALDTVRKWDPPQGKHLMDSAVAAETVGKGRDARNVNPEVAYINPYATAIVVPNPAIKQASAHQAPEFDPALGRLNEEEPLSLLKVAKPWTLMVKSFTVPTRVVTRDDPPGVLGRLFGTDSDAADRLDNTAKQARLLAQGLRHPNMQQSVALVAPRLGLTPRPVESYVLHIRNGSLVCVGAYDNPGDPELLEMQRLLQGLKFQVDYKDGRVPEMRPMFEQVIPYPVPRVK